MAKVDRAYGLATGTTTYVDSTNASLLGFFAACKRFRIGEAFLSKLLIM
jgi:hypothetical protein